MHWHNIQYKLNWNAHKHEGIIYDHELNISLKGEF